MKLNLSKYPTSLGKGRRRMQTILVICTLIGGIAGILYFIERSGKRHPITSLFSIFKKSSRVPINASSLGAFMKSNPRLVTLAREIAENRGMIYKETDSDYKFLHEQVKYFDIKDTRQLDDIIKKHYQIAESLSYYLSPRDKSISDTFVIQLVLDVEAVRRGGLDELIKFHNSLELTATDLGFSKEIYEAIAQISK